MSAPKVETTGKVLNVVVTGFRYADEWCVLNCRTAAGAAISCICGARVDYPFKDLMALKGSGAEVGVIDTGKDITLKSGEVRRRYYFNEWSL